MSVFDLKKGQSARVVSVDVGGAAGERLASLGVVVGAVVTVLGFSLFQGSVLIAVDYNRVGLRKSVASRVGVEA